MAPQVGLEPTTLRLTAGCSAIELLRSVLGARPKGAASFVVIHNIIGGGYGDFKVARDSAQLCSGTPFGGSGKYNLCGPGLKPWVSLIRKRARRAVIVSRRTRHIARLAQILHCAKNACSG